MPSCSTPELPPMNSREHFELREDIVNRFCGQKINKNSRYLPVISFQAFHQFLKIGLSQTILGAFCIDMSLVIFNTASWLL